MESAVIVAIISVVIALASLVFAIYKHFSTRSFSRLAYEISQVSDYGVPQSFLAGVNSAPLSVKFESVGTKKADNIVLRLKTKSQISNQTTEPNGVQVILSNSNELQLKVGELNPTQAVRLFLNCQGNPAEDQVEKFELTHAEGAAVNKKSPAFTNVSFHFWFMDFEFDLLKSRIKLVRLGPWSFK
jgi:hypothetical protein